MDPVVEPPTHYIGLNKGAHHSSACLVSESSHRPQIEIILKERLTRIKGDGGIPTEPISAISDRVNPRLALMAESSYAERPLKFEENLNRRTPIFEAYQKAGLALFTRRFNPRLEFLSHHYCHAMAAVEMSPFRESLIVVLDGAGTRSTAFSESSPEREFFPDARKLIHRGRPIPAAECCTVYLQESTNLKCVHKEWDFHHKNFGMSISGGLGAFYETSADFIFNSRFDAGKVMGLAAFGKPTPINNRIRYLTALDWKTSFRGTGKRHWESSRYRRQYEDIAATVQSHFEEQVVSLLLNLKAAFPRVENLVLTGGCALNCVTNSRIQERRIFRNIYVPPFPSDECIGLGAAAHLRYQIAKRAWRPRGHDEQVSNFGPLSSAPTERSIRAHFAGKRITQCPDPAAIAASLLVQNKTLGWFQGRSESGPRSLGFRSILANPLEKDIKAKLNHDIKGRESFRPYAFSCLWERAPEYCEVEAGFESPFMSFAPKVRADHAQLLGEVTHVDGTSRIQTVRKEQNPLFHRLIDQFGRKSGVYAVLNTSMNVMGEPIVETPADAARFFARVPVDALCMGDFLIERTEP